MHLLVPFLCSLKQIFAASFRVMFSSQRFLTLFKNPSFQFRSVHSKRMQQLQKWYQNEAKKQGYWIL